MVATHQGKKAVRQQKVQPIEFRLAKKAIFNWASLAIVLTFAANAVLVITAGHITAIPDRRARARII